MKNIEIWLFRFTGFLLGTEIVAIAYQLLKEPISGGRMTIIVSALLGLSLATILLWHRRVSPGVKLAVVSLVLCLFALDEACHILSLPSRFTSFQREERARQLGIEYDFRGIPKVIQDLRDQGLDAVAHIAPNFMIAKGSALFPLGGVSDKTVVMCNESGKFSVYPSDEHGFNNPKGLYDSGVEALVIGDSFANGACVQPGEDIASRLREHGLPSLTLGMWGNGPLVELATLAEYGRSLRPAKIFWLYYENDMEDLANEQREPILQHYLEPDFSQHLMQRQPETDALLLAEIDKQYRERTAETLKTQPGHAPGQTESLGSKAKELVNSPIVKDSVSIASLHDLILFGRSVFFNPFSNVELDKFRQVMATAKQLAASWGGQLTFVFLPEFSRYQPVSWLHKLYLKRSKEQILGVARQLGFPMIDIDKVFQAQADPVSLFPLRMMGHYTPEGYALVASVLRKATVEPQAAQ
jgi:hypothetical protein